VGRRDTTAKGVQRVEIAALPGNAADSEQIESVSDNGRLLVAKVGHYDAVGAADLSEIVRTNSVGTSSYAFTGPRLEAGSG
jgi:hypothetical protein